MANVDLSDAEVLAIAKEMHRTWSPAVGKNRRVHACLPWVLTSIVCRRTRERPRALPRAVWGEANQAGPQSVFPSNEHLLFGRSSG